jgi:uncharacterized repeat protein (TIGR03803 family)
MQRLNICTRALSLCAIVAIAGCAGSQSPIIASTNTPLSSVAAQVNETPRNGHAEGLAVKESVLHNFEGSPNDGANPYADLTNVNDALYGTTGSGGANDDGSVFKITLSGGYSLLHSFEGSPNDGADPFGALIDVGGTLYGTTYAGGAYSFGFGTVFKITPSGGESVLYNFGANQYDGVWPYAGLTDLNGTLYGTTFGGGAHENGAVFKITTSGQENVVYSFASGTDGEHPRGGLTDVNGTLYGTTAGGGAYGAGTVFKITASGSEDVVYSFKASPNDGAYPWASLTYVNGTLYGTTSEGGAQDDGTVFKVTTSGVESVLHSFGGSPNDGALPTADLTDVNGTLYGTTEGGGISKKWRGTIFQITPSGGYSVLMTFNRRVSGRNPWAALSDVNGTLYGTTASGGTNLRCRAGCGTVFSLSL